MGQQYPLRSTAAARLARGVCPECGAPVGMHDGLGGPHGCTLTDNGVAQRIHDYKKSLKEDKKNG